MFRQICTPPIVCRKGVVPEVSRGSSFSEDSDYEVTSPLPANKRQRKVQHHLIGKSKPIVSFSSYSGAVATADCSPTAGELPTIVLSLSILPGSRVVLRKVLHVCHFLHRPVFHFRGGVQSVHRPHRNPRSRPYSSFVELKTGGPLKSDCNSNSSITPSLCGIDRYQAKLSKQQKEIEEIDNIHFYVKLCILVDFSIQSTISENVSLHIITILQKDVLYRYGY